MPSVIYVTPDGREHEVVVPAGQSVMDGSVRNNLPGIVAECGGSCSCATCHVYLVEGDVFDPATDEEEDLLSFIDERTSQSRLACQLVLPPECSPVRVRVPAMEY